MAAGARAGANQQAAVRNRTRGPVQMLVESAMQLVMIALFAWLIGLLVEVGGNYTFWKDLGAVEHSRRIAQEDLKYIAQAPRSILVGDTRKFATGLMQRVAAPYEKLGLVAAYERSLTGTPAPVTRVAAGSGVRGQITGRFRQMLQVAIDSVAKWAVVSMHVAQDVVLRMSVAIFALPAFVLACIVGFVDGLVRRDLRRWRGGRESSFVYHHAKAYAAWALTGGFGLYLAWPFGGFNPAYMVFAFTLLVAFTLATAAATFKKYV